MCACLFEKTTIVLFIFNFISLFCLHLFFFIDLLPYSQNGKEDVTQEFLNNLVDKVCKYLSDCNNRETKVIEFNPPEEMMKVIDFEINEEGDKLDTLFGHVDKILRHVVKTG